MTPLKEKVFALPNLQLNEKLQHFFSVFFIQSIIFIIWTPFALSVPAFVLVQSFRVASFGKGILLFLVGLSIFFTWSLISSMFMYSVTEPHTRPRYVALGWFALLIGTFITWIVLFS